MASSNGVGDRAFSRRWLLVAAGAAGLVGAGAITLPAAADDVDPALLRGRILAADPAYVGLVESTGRLGLPEIPRLESVTGLLTGRTRIRALVAAADRWRVDELTPVGERDTYHLGDTDYIWDFGSNQLTRVVGARSLQLPRPADLLPPTLARRLLRLAAGDPVTPLPARRVAGRRAPAAAPPPGLAVLAAAVRVARARRGAARDHRRRPAARSGRQLLVRCGQQRATVPGGGACPGTAGVPADHGGDRVRGHDRRRGRRRDPALPARASGRTGTAAGREAVVGDGVRAAGGAPRGGDRLSRRGGAVRLRRGRHAGRVRWRHLVVRGRAQPGPAGRPHAGDGGLRRSVHAHARRGRAVLLDVDRLAAGRRDPILWTDIREGVEVQAGWILVAFGAAWANFATKDITS